MPKSPVTTYLEDVKFLEQSDSLIMILDRLLDENTDENTDQARRDLVALFTQIEAAAHRCAEYQANRLPSINA